MSEKTKNKNKDLGKGCLMIIVLIIIFSFAIGFGNGNGNGNGDEGVDLPPERQEQIKEWIADATMYDLYEFEVTEGSTVRVVIDLEREAWDNAEGYATGLAERMAPLWDYEQDIQVSAISDIPDSDKVRGFGTATYSYVEGVGGEVSYSTY